MIPKKPKFRIRFTGLLYISQPYCHYNRTFIDIRDDYGNAFNSFGALSSHKHWLKWLSFKKCIKIFFARFSFDNKTYTVVKL